MTITHHRDFPIVPASQATIAKRSLVAGNGINDVNYQVSIVIDGKHLRCPIYNCWKAMLTRCFNRKSWKKTPRYSECYVSSDWFLFSNFRAWMVEQDYEGKCLDKDLKSHNNLKIYGPDTCIFISQEVNSLFGDCRAARGEFTQGVDRRAGAKKYRARCSVEGKRKHLGTFTSELLASQAYLEAKVAECLRVANLQEPIIQDLIIKKSHQIQFHS